MLPFALSLFAIVGTVIGSGPLTYPTRAAAAVEAPSFRISGAAELVRALEQSNPAVPSPGARVLELSMQAYERARAEHRVKHPRLTVIDYSLPSTTKRLWVIDLEQKRILFHELVAHGKGSGVDRAESFSNVPGSLQSSLGLFVTGETYRGGHGYSLRLDGLEAGVNDKARARDIVIHSASYVSPDFAVRHGRLGRSWGCPALRPEVTGRVIDAIKEGGAIFAFHAQPDSL
jgi:hypothetical protein